MSTKKKLGISVLVILVILTLIVGLTSAWFTDLETVGAKFEAGVLDVSVGDDAALNFENLRPMASEEAFLAEINSDTSYSGYDPIPVYLQEFTVTNEGTLPVKLQLSLADAAVPADCAVPNLIDNGIGGIKVGDPATKACDNALKGDHLKLVLLKDNNGTWEKVTALSVADFENGYILPDGDAELILPAGETLGSAYALGAYLDAEAGNALQGAHYHASLVVNAAQTDAGATFAE